MAVRLEWACFVFNILFYLSMIFPFYQLTIETIKFKESPFILLIMAFFTSLFNGIYALKNDLDIFWISYFIGSFITIILIIIFIIFLSKQKIFISLIINIISFLIIILIFYISYTIKNTNIIRIIGIIFNILMYIALNEKIYNVYYSNEYTLIPIYSGICGFDMAVCWLIYEIIYNKQKIYPIIPYICGIVFSFLQIFLYYLFYNKKDDNSEEKKKLVFAEIQSFPNHDTIT